MYFENIMTSRFPSRTVLVLVLRAQYYTIFLKQKFGHM